MKEMHWRFELVGIPFIIVVGSLLHFTFAWSGYWAPVALVAAVNESVWEHLKLAFWPSLAWSVIGYAALRPEPSRYWPAKGISLLIAPSLIILIFYTYTAFVGRNLLALDIATFVIAIVAGQIGSAMLTRANAWPRYAIATGHVLLVCQLIAYSTLTFYPPPHSLFEDSRNGTRGIPTAGTRSE